MGTIAQLTSCLGGCCTTAAGGICTAAEGKVVPLETLAAQLAGGGVSSGSGVGSFGLKGEDGSSVSSGCSPTAE